MCGLAGFTGFDNNNELAEMANKIQQHRGPDNQSIWKDNFIALAHQRLSIIDLTDAANQPFVKNNLIIIFNGEIYNYKELQIKLINEKNVHFVTASDTEVVLEMFNHFGKTSLDYFIGMFAFAIYNVENKSLFIARDHFGIKPIFYTLINNSFAFSSELKTLVKVPGFDKTINSKSLVSCLNYSWVSGNETMFNNCNKLPPAHYLTYTIKDGLAIIKYWELDDIPSIIKSEKEIVKEVSNTVESSVVRHMVADVPVSSFLSGGLDSSLISVFAKDRNDLLSTYTISMQSQDNKIEQMPDDLVYAKKLAMQFNLDQNIIEITSDILKDFPKMAGVLDEPIGDPAAIITYLICKAAQQKGVKVLLSGMGADEIYFGYRRQKATLLSIKYNRLPKYIKTATQTIINFLPVRVFGKGFKLGRWAKRFLDFATLPTDEAYMRSYSYYSPEELEKLLKEKYKPSIKKLKEEHKAIFESKYKGDIINQMCNTDIHMFLQCLNLTYTDRASMAASVEVRVPFVDKILLTKAMQIPGYLKIKGNESKFILKRAAEKKLPKKIIYRSKASFGAPIRSWISNELRSMVDELLSEKNINKRGFINYSFVKNMIDKDRDGKEDRAYQIYQLLTIELWCRAYLD